MEAFEQLSRFERLEKLVLEINDNNIKTSIDKGLVIIANNCKKLKVFSFDAHFESETNFNSSNSQLFQIICEFQSLISCQIDIQFNGNYY